jgi:hypothetical protein
MTKFGSVLEPVSLATEAFGTFDEKLAVVPETAATSAQQTYDAFDTKDWETAGKDAGLNIADGITSSTPAIVAAAKAAVMEAIKAATAAINATGPTTTITPPPPTPGYAEGGYGKVPPGYPDDSYLIGLSSGEEFFVGAFARAQQNINAAVAGMKMMVNVNMAGASGAEAVAGAGIIFTGDIIVNGAPGMDEETLAQKVVDKIGATLEVARSKGMR